MITVFTPTYNRCNDLKRLYNSLCQQDDKNFIWHIIDDGSVDGTDTFISTIVDNSPFRVICSFQENAGKHVAINRFLDTCNEEYAICVDSDDVLSNDAVSIFNTFLNENNIDRFWAVVGPRYSKQNGYNNWNDSIPDELFFSDIYNRFGYCGETFMIWNLKFFSDVRFPVYPGERFMPESAIYDRLDIIAPVKILKRKVYISDYQPDGLTRNSKESFVKNRRGYAIANLISSKNSNRTVLNRSKYFGRFYAIIKRSRISKDEYNISDVDRLVRILGSAIGIGLTQLYKLKGK